MPGGWMFDSLCVSLWLVVTSVSLAKITQKIDEIHAVKKESK
jgi:hypothetical protein